MNRSSATGILIQVMSLKSSSTGRDYDIYVRFPEEYARKQGKKYPVVYVLDGHW